MRCKKYKGVKLSRSGMGVCPEKVRMEGGGR